jgi:hypothetical protein
MHITPEISFFLDSFTLKASPDPLKHELRLTCNACGSHVCDVEPADTLLVLVETAERHRRGAYPFIGSHACPACDVCGGIAEGNTCCGSADRAVDNEISRSATRGEG